MLANFYDLLHTSFSLIWRYHHPVQKIDKIEDAPVARKTRRAKKIDAAESVGSGRLIRRRCGDTRDQASAMGHQSNRCGTTLGQRLNNLFSTTHLCIFDTTAELTSRDDPLVKLVRGTQTRLPDLNGATSDLSG